MKVVYVCSPYRGTPEEVKRNFDYAVELTKEVASLSTNTVVFGKLPDISHWIVSFLNSVLSEWENVLHTGERRKK